MCAGERFSILSISTEKEREKYGYGYGYGYGIKNHIFCTGKEQVRVFPPKWVRKKERVRVTLRFGSTVTGTGEN